MIRNKPCDLRRTWTLNKWLPVFRKGRNLAVEANEVTSKKTRIMIGVSLCNSEASLNFITALSDMPSSSHIANFATWNSHIKYRISTTVCTCSKSWTVLTPWLREIICLFMPVSFKRCATSIKNWICRLQSTRIDRRLLYYRLNQCGTWASTWVILFLFKYKLPRWLEDAYNLLSGCWEHSNSNGPVEDIHSKKPILLLPAMVMTSCKLAADMKWSNDAAQRRSSQCNITHSRKDWENVVLTGLKAS